MMKDEGANYDYLIGFGADTSSLSDIKRELEKAVESTLSNLTANVKVNFTGMGRREAGRLGGALEESAGEAARTSTVSRAARSSIKLSDISIKDLKKNLAALKGALPAAEAELTRAKEAVQSVDHALEELSKTPGVKKTQVDALKATRSGLDKERRETKKTYDGIVADINQFTHALSAAEGRAAKEKEKSRESDRRAENMRSGTQERVKGAKELAQLKADLADRNNAKKVERQEESKRRMRDEAREAKGARESAAGEKLHGESAAALAGGAVIVRKSGPRAGDADTQETATFATPSRESGLTIQKSLTHSKSRSSYTYAEEREIELASLEKKIERHRQNIDRNEDVIAKAHLDRSLNDYQRAKKTQKAILELYNSSLSIEELLRKQALAARQSAGVMGGRSPKDLELLARAQSDREAITQGYKGRLADADASVATTLAARSRKWGDMLNRRLQSYAGYFLISQGAFAVANEVGTGFKEALQNQDLQILIDRALQGSGGRALSSREGRVNLDAAAKVASMWGQDINDVIETQAAWLKQTNANADSMSRLRTSLELTNLAAQVTRASNTTMEDSYESLLALTSQTGMQLPEIKRFLDEIIAVSEVAGGSMRSVFDVRKGDRGGFQRPNIVKQLLEGVETLAPAMRAWDLSQEDLIAAVATFQKVTHDTGGSGAQKLINVLGGLLKTSNVNVMKSEGLDPTRGLYPLLSQIQKMSDKQWTRVAANLGMKPQDRIILNAIATHPEQMDYFKERALSGANRGALLNAATESMQSFSALADRTRAEMQALYLEAATTLMPMIREFFHLLTEKIIPGAIALSRALAPLVPWILKIAGAYLLYAGYAKVANAAHNTFGKDATGLAATGLRGVWGGLKLARDSFIAYRAGADVAAGATLRFGGALAVAGRGMLLALAPMLKVVAILGAIAAAYKLVQGAMETRSDPKQAALKQLSTVMDPKMGGAGPFLPQNWGRVLEWGGHNLAGKNFDDDIEQMWAAARERLSADEYEKLVRGFKKFNSLQGQAKWDFAGKNIKPLIDKMMESGKTLGEYNELLDKLSDMASGLSLEGAA